MSSTSARHRKPPQHSPTRRGAASRSRKPPETAPAPRNTPAPTPRNTPAPTPRNTPSSALRNTPARLVAVAVAGLIVLVCAWPAAAHWMARVPSVAWVGQADALGLQMAGSLGVLNSDQPEVVSVGVAVGPGYINPMRAVSGLVPERIDQGVDFAGTGPVYALGDGVITSANADFGGWPGGGWITYQLTNGPAAGLMVYLAEDVEPTVQVGQHVTALTVIGDMWDGGDGIETGWAMPSGLSAESQLPEAGGIGGGGPFPTMVGLNFDELLQSLGVPAAPNRDQLASGLLPASYPQSWN